MRSPEDIKKGLKCLPTLGIKGCSDCVWHGKGKRPCSITVTEAAVEYIEALEERIQLMMIQMQGDCGVCKHRDEFRYGDSDICYDFDMNSRSEREKPYWEYEGLPGDDQGKEESK